MSDASEPTTAASVEHLTAPEAPKKLPQFNLNNLSHLISSFLRKHDLLNDTTLAIIVITTVLLFLILILFFSYLHKKHKQIRQNQNIQANCHFCNTNQYIKRYELNNWTCKIDVCGQYNGFDENGDYNDVRQITGQKYEGINSQVFNKHKSYKFEENSREVVENRFAAGYKLCDTCNDNQVLKLREEREFDPSDIESDDEETWSRRIKSFKSQLDRKFPLCQICSKTVNNLSSANDAFTISLKNQLNQFKINFNNKIQENLKNNFNTKPSYTIDEDDFLSTGRPKGTDKRNIFGHFIKIIFL